MSVSLAFMIFLPLLVFTIADSVSSLRVALISAIIAATMELGISYFYFGEIDSFSIATILLVVLMAIGALLKNSRRFFYFKPAVLSGAMGLFLVITYYQDHYVLLDGINKYAHLLPTDTAAIIAHPKMQLVYKQASQTVGWAFVVHAFIASYAALKFSRWWWFMVAGVGTHVFMLLGLLAAAFTA